MSGSSSQASTTQQTSPNSGLMPYINSFLGSASSAMQNPYQPYQGMMVAPFTGLQNQAFNGIGASMYGSPATQQAGNYYQNMMSGGAFNNPYLSGAINTAGQGLRDQYNQATLNATGQFGGDALSGSAHQVAQEALDRQLANGLGNVNANMNMQGYQTGQQLMANAAQGAQGLQNNQMNWLNQGLNAGNQQQQYGQNLINANMNQYDTSQNYPWTQLGRFSQLFNPLLGGSGSTTTQTQNPSSLATGLGSLGMIAGGLGLGNRTGTSSTSSKGG